AVRYLELEVLPKLWSLVQERVEHRAVEPKRFDVAARPHGERARGLLEQADFAKGVACLEDAEGQLAIRRPVAGGVLDDARAAGDQEVQRVGGLALAHDGHAEGERHRLEASNDSIANAVRQIAKNGEVGDHVAN